MAAADILSRLSEMAENALEMAGPMLPDPNANIKATRTAMNARMAPYSVIACPSFLRLSFQPLIEVNLCFRLLNMVFDTFDIELVVVSLGQKANAPLYFHDTPRFMHALARA